MTYIERIEKLERDLKRLRKIVCCQVEAGTPVAADDPIRPEGSIMYDDDFIYVMTSAGWASSPLTAL